LFRKGDFVPWHKRGAHRSGGGCKEFFDERRDDVVEIGGVGHMADTGGGGESTIMPGIVEIEAEVGHVVAEIPSPAVVVVEHGLGARRNHGEGAALGPEPACAKRLGDAFGEAMVVGEVTGDKDLAKRGRVSVWLHPAVQVGATGGGKDGEAAGKEA
jgi:hypothetical protein